MNTAETSLPGFARLGKVSLIVGLLALIVCALLGFQNPVQFFRSYLFAFVFWLGLPLGCGAILMIHYMIGGRWGFPLRRPLEAGMSTFFLMAVAALPILFRLPALYIWAIPSQVAADPLLQYKHPYLNVPFFLIRTVVYFGLWLFFATFLVKWARQQNETGDPELLVRLRRLSAPGLLVFGLTITFFCIDWVMSLEPHWYSTIYGMIFMITECLAAMSLMTMTVIGLSDDQRLEGMVTPRLLNDYGNLLLVFTMLWAYLSFSQFLIIWAGNIREEIPWYLVRARGGWAVVALLLIIFHFAVPFFVLLLRFVKRRAQLMKVLALGLIIMSVVDIFWLTVPAFERGGPEFHPTDWLALFGIGGLWLWRFTSQMQTRPALPLKDPRLKDLMQHA